MVMVKIRTIYWYTYFWCMNTLYIFCFLKYFLIGWVQGKESQAKYLLKISRRIAGQVVRAAGGTVTVHGAENVPVDGGILYVANHQGSFDIPILMAAIPRMKGFLAKIELKWIPLLNVWMGLTQCVYINRSNPRLAMKSITRAIELVNQGRSLVVFPEGTRSRSAVMGPFKQGIIRIIKKTNTVIVPITISGSYHLMEAHGGVTPGHVDVYIHPPLRTTALNREAKTGLIEELRQIIAKPLSTPSNIENNGSVSGQQ